MYSKDSLCCGSLEVVCLQLPCAAGLSPEKLQNIIWNKVVILDDSQADPHTFCVIFLALFTMREYL